MSSRYSSVALLVFVALLAAGCDDTLRQDMANQPRINPLAPSTFFDDGRSAAWIIENTVARGSLENDSLYEPKDTTPSRCH